MKEDILSVEELVDMTKALIEGGADPLQEDEEGNLAINLLPDNLRNNPKYTAFVALLDPDSAVEK